MDNKVAEKILKAWRVSRLEIDYADGKWVIAGRCVCDEHPLSGWRTGNFYSLGQGTSLEEAGADALAKAKELSINKKNA